MERCKESLVEMDKIDEMLKIRIENNKQQILKLKNMLEKSIDNLYIIVKNLDERNLQIQRESS